MLEEEKNIKKARRGSAEAFGALYDNYLPKIYRFVLLKTSQKEIAEDLTQQVFLKAWQNVSSYEHKGFPFSSWLYQIARNAVIDHYRTKKTHAGLETAEEIAEETNFSADLEKKINLEIIQKKIKDLSPDYQDVLIMRFVEEMSHREIAQSMGKSEGAIKVIQHRALNQLKKIINQNGTTNSKTQIA